MYMDKLDGRIDNDFFDRKAGEFRSEQSRMNRGAPECELELRESQPPKENRKLLDFVLSNCWWKEGRLDADYRQPFDLIASAAFADRKLRAASGT